MLGSLRGAIQGQFMGALRKKAEVIDNRRFNRLGIIRE